MMADHESLEPVDHKRRDRLLEVALATVVDAVIATDAHGEITYLNSAAESMTGWRSSESFGKPFAEVFFLLDQETGHAIEAPLDGVQHANVDNTALNQA